MTKVSFIDDDSKQNSIFNKKDLYVYLSFWKFFLLSIVISLFAVFLFLRYTNNIYSSSAKIKFLDKEKNSINISSANLFGNSKVNLENEIEVLTSYPILKNVVEEQTLMLNCYVEGDIISSRLSKPPFNFSFKLPLEEIKSSKYILELDVSGYKIFSKDELLSSQQIRDLPFKISHNENSKQFFGQKLSLNILPLMTTINDLKRKIQINKIGRQSEVVSISYNSTNSEYSEIVINSLIDNFNIDGIRDRQLVHKRTIDFINDRFKMLILELDSIESYKQIYKSRNNLIDINLNTKISLEENASSENELFHVENQLLLSKLLLENFQESKNNLLPINLGVENNEINLLISNYNDLIIRFNNLSISAGISNPSYKLIEKNIINSRKNILNSINSYIKQLDENKSQLMLKNSLYSNTVSKMPQKIKVLRNIERNQAIKEKLYLFLLEKREEAEVSYAVTENSIKIVEYAISSNNPIYPKAFSSFLIALSLGFFIPFVIIYLILYFDTKIHSRDDIESSPLASNFIGEIPFFESKTEKEKLFSNPDDRSIISEAFRMIMSNFRYLLDQNKKCNIIISTSSVKGEGKTLSAINLSLAFASLNKKVLLIGCDLRNPQLHKYFDEDKNINGLVDFLVDNKLDWSKMVVKKFPHYHNHDILFSGSLPPNPLNLINNGNLEILVKQAEKKYDIIIIDTAPTLLVGDTLNISNISDAVLYLTRANVTEKNILEYIQKINNEKKLKNIGIVINGVGQKNSYGYSYGYKYGYRYSYKYSYNYGYGYGYSSDEENT